MQLRELKQSFSMQYDYSVFFSEDVFDPQNSLLVDVIEKAGPGPHRVMPVIDSGVLDANPGIISQLENYFKEHEDVLFLSGEPLIFKGGEVCKTAPLEVQQFYDKIAAEGVCRHSFVLSIGGGAVLDASGFAAASAHRGVKLIRMPSTVLAQNDAGVGVKNAINHGKRKNFVGTFAPPFAVINDYSLIKTLAPRDKRSGIAEAIKVALIKDPDFFDSMFESKDELHEFTRLPMENMIRRCAELHLDHIAYNGDPFEQGSARPLDFGHWAAHKLEEMTHSTVKHGEAVAIGVMLDSLYSWRMGLIDDESIQRIYQLIEGVGFNVYHYELDNLDAANALKEFREHLGGKLCITLLDAIGTGREHNTINVDLMQECVRDLKHLHEGKADRIFASYAQLELPLAV